MERTFQFLCNIALYNVGLYFHHQSHPQLGVVFALAPSLFLSGVISPLFSSSIMGTYGPGEFIFQCPIFLPFHTVHGVLKARILEWVVIPFSSGPHFVRRNVKYCFKRSARESVLFFIWNGDMLPWGKVLKIQSWSHKHTHTTEHIDNYIYMRF